MKFKKKLTNKKILKNWSPNLKKMILPLIIFFFWEGVQSYPIRTLSKQMSEIFKRDNKFLTKEIEDIRHSCGKKLTNPRSKHYSYVGEI